MLDYLWYLWNFFRVRQTLTNGKLEYSGRKYLAQFGGWPKMNEWHSKNHFNAKTSKNGMIA
jgi:hypothetical protein